jgi:hypothetical protein
LPAIEQLSAKCSHPTKQSGKYAGMIILQCNISDVNALIPSYPSENLTKIQKSK